MGHCFLCDEPVPTLELLNHVRVVHPDVYGDGMECWPDGKPVIIDTTDYSADEIGGAA